LRVARGDVVEAQNRGLEIPLLEVTVREPERRVVGVLRSRERLQELPEAVNALLVIVAAPRVVGRAIALHLLGSRRLGWQARRRILARALRRGPARGALRCRKPRLLRLFERLLRLVLGDFEAPLELGDLFVQRFEL